MRMTIVGQNPRSAGSECIIFGHIGRDSHLFAPVSIDMRNGESKGGELSSHGGWDVRPMRPGGDLATAPALVGELAGADFCRTTGRLVLVSHRWSGKLQINDIGRKYTIDLYSADTRLVLLDVINGVVVDVTRLAVAADGAIALPDMAPASIVEHIVQRQAWFSFLEPDADFDPGWLRRTLEAFRHPPDDRLKRRLVRDLLPALATRPPPPAPVLAPPPAPHDDGPLRDEMRLLAAAVEGLALRAAAQA